MTIILAFCNKDAELALMSAKVITKHGLNMRHEAAIICPQGTAHADAIQAELLKSFPTVNRIVSQADPLFETEGKPDGWPLGSNQMFSDAMVWASSRGKSWMFYEGDCVAMRTGWVDELQDGFDRSGVKILGDVVKSSGPEPKTFISGTAIYAHDIPAYCPLARNLDGYNRTYRLQKIQPMAWDCYCRHEFLKVGKQTELIRSYWKSENYRRDEFGTTVFDYTAVDCPPLHNQPASPLAAVIHGCKDGSLHKMFLDGVPAPIAPVGAVIEAKPVRTLASRVEATTEMAEPVKRHRGRSAMKKGRKLNLSIEERKARSERAKINLKGRVKKLPAST